MCRLRTGRMGQEVLHASGTVRSGGGAAEWGEENREQLVTTPLVAGGSPPFKNLVSTGTGPTPP